MRKPKFFSNPRSFCAKSYVVISTMRCGGGRVKSSRSTSCTGFFEGIWLRTSAQQPQIPSSTEVAFAAARIAQANPLQAVLALQLHDVLLLHAYADSGQLGCQDCLIHRPQLQKSIQHKVDY